MRGLLVGLVLVPLLVIGVLSIRPGGLRQQLRNVRRRLKLALVLAGIYLLAATLAKFLVGDQSKLDIVEAGMALVLGVVFVFLGQDARAPAVEPARPAPPAASGR